MNVVGNKFRFSSFGESHGKLIGTIINGCPPGVPISEEFINKNLEERRPGFSKLTSTRKEEDKCEIISGVLNGKSTGAPITVIVKNQNVKSEDYSNLKNIPRPGHADFPASVKYNGFNDIRGGGRFSGRLTISHVVAGSIAQKILEKKGITIETKITEIGGKESNFEEIIESVKNEKDSIGGIIKTSIKGLPVALGEPIYLPVESVISSVIFTIPGIVGIEFGDGFKVAKQKGSEHNDPYYYENQEIKLKSNHCGGVLGGLTTGSDLEFSVVVKPTSSIGIPQDSVDMDKKENVSITIKGRHDPCIVIRANPVIKFATWAIILDLYLLAEKL